MKIIEFAGMPKAGKSTQMEIIGSELQHQYDYNVRYIHEGARISPLDKSDTFAFNSWSFHNTLNKMLEAQLTKYDFILIDRGVYDHEAFTKALYLNRDITSEELENSVNYFRCFRDREDLVFLHLIEPEVSMKREYKYEKPLGRRLNKNFLQLLYKSYEEMVVEKEHIIINGNNSIEDNAKEIRNYLSKVLNL